MAALSLLRTRDLTPETVEDSRESIEWVEPDGQRMVRSRRRLRFESDLHSLDEYRACREAIVNYPALHSLEGRWIASEGLGRYIDDASDMMGFPILNLVHMVGSRDARDEETAEPCDLWVSRLRSETVEQTLLAPTHDFVSDVTPAQLSEDWRSCFSIRSNSRCATSRGCRACGLVSMFAIRFRPSLPRLVGDIGVSEQDGDEALRFQQRYREIERALLALRLFQAGEFASPGVLRYTWRGEFASVRIAFDARSGSRGGLPRAIARYSGSTGSYSDRVVGPTTASSSLPPVLRRSSSTPWQSGSHSMILKRSPCRLRKRWWHFLTILGSSLRFTTHAERYREEMFGACSSHC